LADSSAVGDGTTLKNLTLNEGQRLGIESLTHPMKKLRAESRFSFAATSAAGPLAREAQARFRFGHST
jgi:hypothetical protein